LGVLQPFGIKTIMDILRILEIRISYISNLHKIVVTFFSAAIH
jgi:hypothetical protein